MNAKVLADRTEAFAHGVRMLVRGTPQTHLIMDDCKQLLRSSASIAANYLEAKEALSRRDFLYRIRISRKEAFETKLWLSLISIYIPKNLQQDHAKILIECLELMKIFSAIAKTTQENSLKIANAKIAI